MMSKGFRCETTTLEGMGMKLRKVIMMSKEFRCESCACSNRQLKIVAIYFQRPRGILFAVWFTLMMTVALPITCGAADTNVPAAVRSRESHLVQAENGYSIVYWTNRYSVLFHDWRNCYRLLQLRKELLSSNHRPLSDAEVLWILSRIPPSIEPPIHDMYARINIVFDDLLPPHLTRFQKEITSSVLEHMLSMVAKRAYNGMGTSRKGNKYLIIEICNKLVALHDIHVIPTLSTICASPSRMRCVNILVTYLAEFRNMTSVTG